MYETKKCLSGEGFHILSTDYCPSDFLTNNQMTLEDFYINRVTMVLAIGDRNQVNKPILIAVPKDE